MKKTFMIIGLVTILTLSSLAVITASYGSKSDPLVSLSYITEVLIPQTLTDADAIITSKTNTYNNTVSSKISSFESNFDALSGSDSFVSSVAEQVNNTITTSTVFTMTEGQTLVLSSGSEVLFRYGSATVPSGYGIVNVTTGKTVIDNESIVTNNLYLSAENAQKITVTQDTKVIVYGAYSVQ